LNGNAFQENCNCYTITPDAGFMSGSVWNKNKIDLNQSFNFIFNINLGCNDYTGADGIVFVLQPLGTSIGSRGEGLGYEGVSPSIGIAIDTYQNAEKGDPPDDNISIHRNGIMHHSAADDVVAPVSALANGGNIEDCSWHLFRIVWDANSKTLTGEIDGIERVRTQINLVTDIFKNDPLVYWGFTGATGGSTNRQRVCTSLNPHFYLAPDQKTCYPEPIRFLDSSKSFGTITKWYWNFGDGQHDSSTATPPPHTYPAPGNYQAKLAILGNNGCVSDTFEKTITVGSKPIAKFGYSPQIVCEEAPVTMIDSSYVEFGTISIWKWKVGDRQYDFKKPNDVVLSGTNNILLTVSTIEGCVSDEVMQTVTTRPSPVIDFEFFDVCVTEIPVFTAVNLGAHPIVSKWIWDFGDSNNLQSIISTVNHKYTRGGAYKVVATGLGDNGCTSLPVSNTINIYETKAFAGNDTIVARNQPVQLKGSGGEIYKWSPAAGLNADNIADPVSTLQHDAHYVLTVSTPAGCETSDTLNIKVYEGPDLYVPSAFSPNSDGHNDQFRFIAVGMASVDLFQVYNRYGQLVYASASTNKGWDGTIKGIAQPSGTYVWMIRGVDFSGKLHSKKGTVTLIR
jgi:gliding motility-associated-like protein